MPLQNQGGVLTYNTSPGGASFIPASGGSFTFANGSGGPDIGAFSVPLQMAPPATFSNVANLATITRSNGLTVNWTGGDPNSTVDILGLSVGSVGGSSTDFVGAVFTCLAPASAGTFTVSPAVLLSLPASASVEGISFSTLTLSNGASQTFTATGLDYGFASAGVANTITVTYQ